MISTPSRFRISAIASPAFIGLLPFPLATAIEPLARALVQGEAGFAQERAMVASVRPLPTA